MSDEKKGWEKEDDGQGHHAERPADPAPVPPGRNIHNINLDDCNVYAGTTPPEVMSELVSAVEALALASAEHAKALKAMARALGGGGGKNTNVGIMIGGDAK